MSSTHGDMNSTSFFPSSSPIAPSPPSAISPISTQNPSPSPPQRRSSPSTSVSHSPSPSSFSSPEILFPDMTVVAENSKRNGKPSSKNPRPGLVTTHTEPTTKGLPFLSEAVYTLPPPPAGTFGVQPISLAELAHLVRLQSYQELKHSQSRIRLHRQLISSALSNRLLRSGDSSRLLMVEYFKADQKKDFATLYNAVHDLKDSCERLATLQPELDLSKNACGTIESDRPRTWPSFFQDIPTQSKDALLRFISSLRSDSRYLADLLAKLPLADLENIVRFHQPPVAPDSVLPTGRKGATVQSSTPNVVEKLLSLSRTDPLSVLIHNVFANSTGPDSLEDKRRTDVWATVCTRLLSEKKGEKFLFAVMDCWVALREWPAKANLETCLMGFLQDGAFLLDQPDQASGTKISSELSRKHDHLAEEFYAKAVRKLFEVLDGEPSAGGIPEGILELGNAILKKIEDPKKQKSAEVFIVAKWFFSKYLNNAIQYPEQHSMLVGYHVSEYARQRIFRNIVQRMCTSVFRICYPEWKGTGSIDPIVRSRIESILARFRHGRSKDSAPILLPAKSLTSPRETAEVQPYLVLCPSDIVTVFNALYPEAQRPMTGTSERDVRNRSYGRSTLSSRPLLTRPPSIFETGSASILSQSGSSLNSDSGLSSVNAPLLDFLSNQNLDEKSSSGLSSPSSFMMPPPLKPSGASIHSIQSITSEQELEQETYAYEIKSAVSEMIRSLGSDVTTGRVHPCAEKWAVLFVSPNGKDVSTRMKADWDDEDDEDDDDSRHSDSEDEGALESSGAGKDYLQVRHAIMKLVDEYEVPEEMIASDSSKPKKFSNRTSTSLRKQHSTIASSMPTYVRDQNPYHSAGGLTALFDRHPRHDRQRLELPKSEETERETKDTSSVLMAMLSAASSQCIARDNFVDGQNFHKAVLLLRKLSSSLARDGYAELLRIISRGFKDSIEKSAAGIEHLEAWFAWLNLAQERHDHALNEMLREIKTLRVKMWYVTDVRNSAAYDDARNVALALKKMGIPSKPSSGRPISHQRSKSSLSHRMSTSSFSLLKGDSLIDTIAAPIEYGGPNKLSDEQAELTKSWLNRYKVENFCLGEERIHRFCCEIDKCINKLVGDKILTGPVLWSSELFSRDANELASLRRKGDFHLAGVGNLSMPLDDGYETDDALGHRRRGEELRPKASAGDLFSIGRTRSHSIVSNMSDAPSSRPKPSRGSNSESMMDKQDPFGMPTNSLGSDTTTSAYWSPFGSVGQSRSRAAQSPTSTLMAFKSPEVESMQRREFVAQLKKDLTGLLLSDLGLEVWSQGSETDAWFSGGLADECLQRKEDQEQATRKVLQERNQSGTKLGGSKKPSRKRSTKSLRKSVNLNTGIFEALGKGEKGELAAPVATLENIGHELHSGEENSSSSDATARSSNNGAAGQTGGLLIFPYGLAFRRLLLRFSTHPNPFAKLKALHELEILIVASLSTSTGRTIVRRGGSLPTVPNSQDFDISAEVSNRMSNLQVSQPTNLGETIATVDERRHAGGVGSPFMTPTGSRSPVSSSIASTDMIVEVWQRLFRQADIRPRTLFRDLQFVAAFVPSATLDMTDQGKAFWDMAYAALTLKVEVCKTMVEVADEIVGYHTNRRGTDTKSAADKANSKPMQPEWISRYSMKDAANMWMITAKEGDATAQRELAIFYLTNPSLLPLTTKPLSKTKDTFRSDMMTVKGADPEKCDPARLCVSHHWMELSAREDDLARKYLRQREEW